MIWIVNAVIAVLLAGIIYRRLLVGLTPAQEGGAVHVDRRTLNAAIYQERLAELEIERNREALSADAFEQMKQELQATLLKDVSDTQTTGSASESTVSASPSDAKGFLILTLGIAAMMLLLYYLTAYTAPLQAWEMAKKEIEPTIQRLLVGEEVSPEELGQFEVSTFVRVLQHHQQLNPHDKNGWFILANIFREHQMLEPAYQAARKAYELAPNELERVATYADLIIKKHQGKLTAESEQVLNRYLAKEAHPSLLAMKAGAAFSAGQYRMALSAWQQLLAMTNEGINGTTFHGDIQDKAVRARVIQGRRYLEKSIALAKQKLVQQESTQEQSHAPANTSTSPSTTAQSAGAPLTYVLQLELASELRAQWPALLASASDQPLTLFVFIKAAQGPPMPLAVKRIEVQPNEPLSFPYEVSLSQEDSMVPSMKLADYAQVTIVARLTTTGQAIASAGDWQGVLANWSRSRSGSAEKPLRLLIGEQIQ